jgi:hypothetical protein
MVKPEEVEAFLALGQVHDAGLGRLGFQPELGQQRGQPRQRGLGLLPALHITTTSSAKRTRTPCWPVDQARSSRCR